MARTSLTRNLRLKVSSDLTADSKYNLERIDSLAGLISTSTEDNTLLRSLGDIHLLPNSADIGGTGSGGSIILGSPDQLLTSLEVWASSLSIGGSLSLADQAAGGTKALDIQYKSDISGSTDTAADRTLSLDLQGADRNLVLGGNFSLSGNLSLTAPISTAWVLPVSAGVSGQVLSTDGTGTLSWISAAAGSLSALSDVQLATPASSQSLVFNGTKWENRSTYEVFTWVAADGLAKTCIHTLGTDDLIVQVKDGVGYLIDMDIQLVDSSTVTLTSSDLPTGTWTIFLYSLR